MEVLLRKWEVILVVFPGVAFYRDTFLSSSISHEYDTTGHIDEGPPI